tara:strand:- start:3863 stop:4258 length:396 start_codon:yes stop_codon:yes gene_type:complete
MTRALLFLTTPAVRQRAAEWAQTAPHGSRLELKGPKRTTDQNSRLWAMLTDVADQKEHHGRRYSSDQWKVIFLAAIGREVQFIPSLDGKAFIPWGQSSSDLSKAEMSALIEFIAAWGAENGVRFQDIQAVA